MRIRPAQPQDSIRIGELNRRFNGGSGRLGDIGEGPERVLVVELDRGIVGFACVQINRSICHESPWAELTELFVDEPARRRGIGKALVAEAERLAWSSGCSELVLRTHARNSAARALFANCGLEEAEHLVFRKRREDAAVREQWRDRQRDRRIDESL